MKKFIGFLSVLLIIAIYHNATALEQDNAIKVYRVHNAVTLSASATSEGNVAGATTFNLGYLKPAGFFSLQYVISGAGGTVKFEYLLSNDGVTFLNTGTDIGATLSKTSGPGSDGKDLLSFRPEPAMFMRILATEDGTSSAATVTTHLFIQ